MRYPVVRIDCADPMDRSEWIPLSKVEKIKINLDGTDYVLASGNWEVCYEGCFNISDYFSEEFADTPQTERTRNNCGRDKAMCLYCEERSEWTPQTDCGWK